MTDIPYYGGAIRMPHRMLFAEAVKDNDEEFPAATDCWLSTQFDKYLVRTAHLCVVSNRGGSPLTLATQTSDKYDGRPVWQPNLSVSAGDEYGYCNTVYEALNAGLTGSTPPTHLAGDVSDGSVVWRFKEQIMRTPTGLNVLLDNDGVKDGFASWLLYLEMVRRAGAGSTFSEWANKNCGDLVISDPYNTQPSGCSVSMRMVAGGDNSYGPASTNPSTAAFTFESLSQQWVSALVFADGAFMPDAGGACRPVKFAKGHRITWYAAAGQIAADLFSEVTSYAERVGLGFYNRMVQARCQGVPVATFESGAAAGTQPDNYMALIAYSAATGYAEVKARSAVAADVDVKVTPKGAGKLRYGSVKPITTETSITGFVEIKDATTGALIKLAVVG